MTNTKHTPGQWELNYSFFDKEGVYWEVEGKDGEHIAQNQFGGNTRETEPERLVAGTQTTEKSRLLCGEMQ
jgi:hypothetical protein